MREVTRLTPISIWDIPEQGTRGPRSKYDRTAVAAAAIRLADAAGLDAVTMRAVAAELGIAPMSLYNYVPTKDHLIQLMTDMAGGEYRYPDPSRPTGGPPSPISPVRDATSPGATPGYPTRSGTPRSSARTACVTWTAFSAC